MNKPSPDKLKSCPFCGEPKTLYVERLEGTVQRPAYRIACDNCGASSRYSDRGDHVAIWNMRAGDA